jgi:predicted TIM-barrel fold metal-dependent hydrolase
VGVLGVMNMIEQVGCGKILYSSDNIYNIPVELAKYRSVVKSPEELEKILYKNAVEIYDLKI